MTRVSPPELARSLPAPQASTSVTRAPPRSRCRAVQPPNAPAPTTTTCIELRFFRGEAPAAAATIGTVAVWTNARREMRRFELMRRDDNGLPVADRDRHDRDQRPANRDQRLLLPKSRSSMRKRLMKSR